jgi:L-amino acid N-acyltransferase YncA
MNGTGDSRAGARRLLPPPSVRDATAADAAAMAAIYAPVVRDTPISFDLEPPPASYFEDRIEEIRRIAPCLVAEDAGNVTGYAWAAPFRARPAYRFTLETSVYVREDARGRGVGRALYGVLLPRLVEQGFRTAIAGITVPNAPSVGLHEAVGFRRIGVFPSVGYKFGRWHDVGFWERELGPRIADPPEPRAPGSTNGPPPGTMERPRRSP